MPRPAGLRVEPAELARALRRVPDAAVARGRDVVRSRLPRYSPRSRGRAVACKKTHRPHDRPTRSRRACRTSSTPGDRRPRPQPDRGYDVGLKNAWSTPGYVTIWCRSPAFEAPHVQPRARVDPRVELCRSRAQPPWSRRGSRLSGRARRRARPPPGATPSRRAAATSSHRRSRTRSPRPSSRAADGECPSPPISDLRRAGSQEPLRALHRSNSSENDPVPPSSEERSIASAE